MSLEQARQRFNACLTLVELGNGVLQLRMLSGDQRTGRYGCRLESAGIGIFSNRG